MFAVLGIKQSSKTSLGSKLAASPFNYLDRLVQYFFMSTKPGLKWIRSTT